MTNPFTLEGKTILVTGASSGIGKAIAIECSRMGASILATGRNGDRLNETYRALEGNTHKQFIADLTDVSESRMLVEAIPEIQGIVHCAGIVKTLPFQFVTIEQLEHIMNVNFTAPTLLTQQVIKNKKIKKGASVVFISSISGVSIAMPGNSMYSASKGAINGMMKGMALDLASKGIRVNSVNPGMILTDLFHEGTLSEEQLEEDRLKYPMKRFGKPEEVAYATIYFLSDASAWVTGSSLIIDGGYTIK